MAPPSAREPEEKDKRTLTKQPACKLMERKLELLQAPKECTAAGRGALRCVWGWAQLTSPVASVSPLCNEPSDLPEVLDFLLGESGPQTSRCPWP